MEKEFEEQKEKIKDLIEDNKKCCSWKTNDYIIKSRPYTKVRKKSRQKLTSWPNITDYLLCQNYQVFHDRMMKILYTACRGSICFDCYAHALNLGRKNTKTKLCIFIQFSFLKGQAKSLTFDSFLNISTSLEKKTKSDIKKN